jgi:uncharacterized surface protein with fasciclin (FAS1) repeats
MGGRRAAAVPAPEQVVMAMSLGGGRDSAAAAGGGAYGPVISGAESPVSVAVAAPGLGSAGSPLILRPGEPLAVPVAVENGGLSREVVTFMASERGAAPKGLRALGIAGPFGASGVSLAPGERQEVDVLLYASPGTLSGNALVTLLAVDAQGRAAALSQPLEASVVAGSDQALVEPAALAEEAPQAEVQDYRPEVAPGSRLTAGDFLLDGAGGVGSGMRLGRETRSVGAPTGAGCAVGAPAVEEFLEQQRGTTALLKALRAVGGARALPAGGDVTWFAPTDEAFLRLLNAIGVSLDQLLESPKLSKLVLHHAVPGAYTPEDLVAFAQQGSLRSLADATLELEVPAPEGVPVVGNCPIREGPHQICGGLVYVVDCVLPPPSPEPVEARVSSVEGVPGGGAPFEPLGDFAGDYGGDYGSDYSLDYGVADAVPTALGEAPGSGSGAGRGGQEQERSAALQQELPRASVPGVAAETSYYPESAGADAPAAGSSLTTALVDAENLRASDSAGGAVKATMLPPEWNKWVHTGISSCEQRFPKCGSAPAPGNCLGEGVRMACGSLAASGPASYSFQPPRDVFRGGFTEFSPGTLVWQPAGGESAYCTPLAPAGDEFQGPLVHEAWAEGNAPGADLTLMLLRNDLTGGEWEVAAMDTRGGFDQPPGVRHIRFLGEGCFRWVVASNPLAKLGPEAPAAGDYSFYYTAAIPE